MSITIIAWAMLIGGVSCVLPVSAGTPAFLAGLELVGWPARLLYASFGALSLYIGWGLLKLRERVRLVAIAWFSVSLAHIALVTLVPGPAGAHARVPAEFHAPAAAASAVRP